AVHAHVLGSLRDVSLVLREGLGDEPPFEALDHLLLGVLEGAWWPGLGVAARTPERCREIVEADLPARGEGDGLLDGVLELPLVSRPCVREQCPVCRWGQCRGRSLQPLCGLP